MKTGVSRRREEKERLRRDARVGVSRRREEKERLRHDARVGYRAVARRRGAYAAMPAKTPRCPYKSVSRRREKKKRLHRDDIPKT